MNILRVPVEALEVQLNDGERDVPVKVRFDRHAVDLTVEQPGHFLQLSLHIVRGRVQLVTGNYTMDDATNRPQVTELFHLPAPSDADSNA